MKIAARMRIPPIVGVPFFPSWVLGPSSRIGCMIRRLWS